MICGPYYVVSVIAVILILLSPGPGTHVLRKFFVLDFISYKRKIDTTKLNTIYQDLRVKETTLGF